MDESYDNTARELFFARSQAASDFQQKVFWFAGPERPEEVTMRPVIAALPLRRVLAGDADTLAAQGYKVGECHRNCMAASAADPTVRHVFGWTVHRDYYLSHSVLQMADGDHVCITPGHTDELGADGKFEFREDDEISCDGRATYRSGVQLSPWWTVIRRDAVKVGQRCAELETRVRSGELTFDEAMALWNM